MSAENLDPNAWNPNHVAAPEMELLAHSLTQDGWTQPVVATAEDQIVDGFHRWTLAQRHRQVHAMTGGLVPIVRTRLTGTHERMASTIRHNRARGVHGIRPMAAIVRSLSNEGLTNEQIAASLGMENEEVRRLLDVRGMVEKHEDVDFSKGWVPSKSKG